MNRSLIWIALLVTVAVVACTSGDESAAPRFVPLDADAVRDTHTGLVWAARDAGRELSWPEADRYCGALASNSSSVQWRLPTIDELAALYDASMEEPCGPAAICRIAPALHLSSPYLWSATAPQSERRAYYDFSLGSQLAPLIRPTLTRGVLCAQGA